MFIFAKSHCMKRKNNHVFKINSFSQGDGRNFPFNKPVMNDLWICKLKSGTIEVSYMFANYKISAREGGVCFVVADGISFSIIAGSDDFELVVMSVDHDTMSLIYPQLDNEVIDDIVFLRLIDTSMMDASIGSLILNAFGQGELLNENIEANNYDNYKEGLVVNFISYFIYLFQRGVSLWRREHEGQTAMENNMGKQIRSFQIMSDLSEIFNETESFLHRDVNYFANRLHISVRYFFQVCQKETGMTPKEFINDIITSEIKHALRTTSLSAQEISLKFAFPDQSAFTQYFKRCTGMTPSEFRNSH